MKIRDLFEATRVAPSKPNQIKKLKRFFDKPCSVSEAQQKLKGLIESDDLNELLDYVARTDPQKDSREIVAQWTKENIPDFASERLDTFNDGTRSPIFTNVDDMKPE